MGGRAPNVPAPEARAPMGGERATTAGAGPQQMGRSGNVGGLAPWLRQSTTPLSPMAPRGPQLAQGQAQVLAQQRALADQLRASSDAELARRAAEKGAAAAPPPTTNAAGQALDAGGQPITASTPSALIQTQEQYLAWLAAQNASMSDPNSSYSGGY